MFLVVLVCSYVRQQDYLQNNARICMTRLPDVRLGPNNFDFGDDPDYDPDRAAKVWRSRWLTV